MTQNRPSDVCLTLAALTTDGEWLDAEQIIGRLDKLGFATTSQAIAAQLRRLAKMDAPPIEVADGPFGVKVYRAHRVFGVTWVRNELPFLPIRF